MGLPAATLRDGDNTWGEGGDGMVVGVDARVVAAHAYLRRLAEVRSVVSPVAWGFGPPTHYNLLILHETFTDSEHFL